MWFPGYTGMGIVSWKALTLQKWQKLDSISILLAVPFMQQCDIYWRFIFQESCCWCLLWPIEGQLPIRESNSKDQTVLPNITANFPSRCPLLGLSKSKTIYHDKVCIHTLIRENVESQNACKYDTTSRLLMAMRDWWSTLDYYFDSRYSYASIDMSNSDVILYFCALKGWYGSSRLVPLQSV